MTKKLIQSGIFTKICLPMFSYMFPTPHPHPPSDIFFKHTVYGIMPPKQEQKVHKGSIN